MNQPSARWYHNPMMWLVAAIPAATVVAGFATLVIAIRSGSGAADSVRDRVQRTAQVQTADLRTDREAARLGLSATLSRDLDTGAVALALRGAEVDAARLRLSLSHPTNAKGDAELLLVRQGERWLGRLPSTATPHDWLLALSPEDGRWLLRGRLRATAADAALTSRHADPEGAGGRDGPDRRIMPARPLRSTVADSG